MPPMLPGTVSVPWRLGGVKIPSLRNCAMVLRHASRSWGVGPQASAAESVCAASGGGASGNGCVGEVTSPGTSLCGTGRSSTGNTGLPVSRFSTYSMPDLLPWITTGTSWPLWRRVASRGGEALSKSQRSWWTS